MTASADIARKRETLAMTAARHAAFDGWTETALKAAAREMNLTQGEVGLLLPGGILDWIENFSMAITRAMQDKIAANRAFSALKVREKIAFAVRARLETLTPFRESVRRLQSAMIFPPSRNLLALRLMHRLTDTIWRAAGDASVDFNYYTKRGLLAGIYTATQLYWVNDDSEDKASTWAFLDRRIGNVMTIGKAISGFRKTGAA